MKELSAMGKKVLEIVKDNPGVPSWTLARQIYKKYEDGFSSIDAVRTMVRCYRGARGGKLRESMKENGVYARSPVIPTDSVPWLPWIFPASIKSALFISDLHIPFHHPKSIEIALNEGRKAKVDCVYINGDLIDFYQCSFFRKDPSKRNIISELDLCNEFLDYVQDMFPGKPIILKEGNHEERLDNYIQDHCPALWGMDGLNLASQLEVKRRKMVLVNDKRIVKFGKLNLVHGHEFTGGPFGSPVNPARSLFLKTKISCVAGHEHQASSHSETDLNGQLITCWSVGALCDLHPEYRRINKWCHGYAIMKKAQDGNYKFENFKLIDNQVYPA